MNCNNFIQILVANKQLVVLTLFVSSVNNLLFFFSCNICIAMKPTHLSFEMQRCMLILILIITINDGDKIDKLIDNYQ